MAELKGESSPYIQKKGQLDFTQNLTGQVGVVKLSGKMGAGLTSTIISVIDYDELDTINVLFGVEIVDLGLPTSFIGHLSNNTFMEIEVTSWTNLDNYAPTTAGIFTFKAVYSVPETIEGTLCDVFVFVVNRSGYIVATGGSVYTVGDYKNHVFNTNGNFMITDLGETGKEIEVFVIGGGGGGGSATYASGGGGGGGAGGYLTKVISNSLLSANINYPATIGAGGAGGIATPRDTWYGNPGNDGTQSTFMGDTADGGGGGGSYGGYAYPDDSDGRSGASGGGGSGGVLAAYGDLGGTGIAGQGYAGGRGLGVNSPNTNRSGGGGGGCLSAGGVGSNSASGGGARGAGETWNFTGTARVYCIGGRGGDYNTATNSGTANTGQGGSGARYSNTTGVNYAGGNGASGVVIVRYKFQN